MASFPTCAWVRGLLDLVEVCAEDGGREALSCRKEIDCEEMLLSGRGLEWRDMIDAVCMLGAGVCRCISAVRVSHLH